MSYFFQVFFGKLLCSLGVQSQQADLVLLANKSMQTHNNLLISARLAAQGALLTSVNVRKFLVSLLILKQGRSFLFLDSHIRFLNFSPMNSSSSTDHGLFLSHLRQHRGSSLCGHLAMVGLVRSLMPFWYSFKMKTDLAQTKTKSLPDSSLYDPYQALSSSNPSLQALFTGIAIRRGINGECNFFKIIFCGNFLYCNY